MKSRWVISVAVVFVGVLCAGAARAAYSNYLKLEGVTGESSPPGLPDATKIRSLTLGQNTLSETQYLDSSSPQILITDAFNHATVAFYKDPNTATEPYEEILFNDLIVSSIQTTTFDTLPSEKVTFDFVSPAEYLYLALPGSGSIPIDSLTISGNTFSVHKTVDASSPGLALALANGTPFSTASLLAYPNLTGPPPDLSLVFVHALISSIVTDTGGELPGETISFVAADSTLPEPGVAALLALGGLAGAAVRMRRR